MQSIGVIFVNARQIRARQFCTTLMIKTMGLCRNILRYHTNWFGLPVAPLQVSQIANLDAVRKERPEWCRFASVSSSCLGTSFSIWEKIILQWNMALFSYLIQQVMRKLIIPIRPESGRSTFSLTGQQWYELHQARLKNIQSVREVEMREEKVRVLKATMRTVQDITVIS